MTISRFGQRIKLEVFTQGNTEPFFTTEELRVDFNVKQLQGYNRAKIDIWNLENNTVKQLTNGTNIAKVSTALHDEEYQVLVENMYVSNAMRETLVPNDVTSLYCYDVLRKEVMEKQVNFTCNSGSLENIISRAAQEFKGVPVKFLNFPTGALNHVPPKPTYTWSGSFERLMWKLGKQNNFKYFLIGESIHCMYIPQPSSIDSTNLKDVVPITLDSTNMRGNPKIGPATIQIVSNLDTRIIPTSVFDVSQLITASSGASEETTQLANNYIRSVVSGFNMFQCLSTEHIGSNWTNQWETRATAVAPRKGTKMPTYNWFG